MLVEIDLAVAVHVLRCVLPHHARIRVVDGDVAVGFDDGLNSLYRNWLLRVGPIDGELLANVAALRGIDAPQNSDAFPMLRILARAKIDLVIIDDGCADDVVARAAAA